MTIKLFTIGDSISQGFMSLAAARTDLSYSTLLAEKLGVNSQDYRYPEWSANGLPINLEAIMRKLTKRFGPNIQGAEWLFVLHTVNEILDEAEDFYERGPGRADLPYGDGRVEFFHNIAIQGFKVADAWLVTPELCQQQIKLHDKRIFPDGYLAGPSVPFYRTALKVLNPSLKPKYNRYNAIKWLATLAKDEGIENVVLWLGANNALGTVIDLEIRPTPNSLDIAPHKMSYIEREKTGHWNLWHPNDFIAEYDELIQRTEKALAGNKAAAWKVFLATIPMVTIAPVAKGVGSTSLIPRIDENGHLKEEIYYKYYTYFPFEEAFAHRTGKHLTMQDAILIDESIRKYNRHIKQTAAQLNTAHGQERYFVVDIATALDDMAYKRNNSNPKYVFPPYFDYKYPQVNTKYYHADEHGRLKQGGIVSLDGVHPTVIGHGLIAYEFLKVMEKEAQIVADSDLYWERIFANDRLYQEPIPLMHEIYGYDKLGEFIVMLLQLAHANE